MTNYSIDDRVRSTRRFLMAALGSPPWRLRTARAEVKDEERPVGLIEADTPVATKGSSKITIPQGQVARLQTLTITLYPAWADGDGKALHPDAARLLAHTAAQTLEDAIQFGLVNDDGTAFSLPERIPCFDYSAVEPVGELSGKRRVIPQVPYGWLHLDDFPVTPRQDSDDLSRWTVTLPLRMSWDQGGRVVDPSLPNADGVLPRPPTVTI